MGITKETLPVKLIISLIFARSELISKVIGELVYHYGKIDFISELLNFDHTKYYNKEMGNDLERKILSFEKLIDPGILPEIKNFTNNLEKKYLHKANSRIINIDPGYLDFHHLILATTKSYAHRPYLRMGIYADLTLIFKAKTFHPLDWTYPDYSSDPILEIMEFIRKKHVFKIRNTNKFELMGKILPC
jgi:hypothetical protein